VARRTRSGRWEVAAALQVWLAGVARARAARAGSQSGSAASVRALGGGRRAAGLARGLSGARLVHLLLHLGHARLGRDLDGLALVVALVLDDGLHAAAVRPRDAVRRQAVVLVQRVPPADLCGRHACCVRVRPAVSGAAAKCGCWTPRLPPDSTPQGGKAPPCRGQMLEVSFSAKLALRYLSFGRRQGRK